MDFSYVKIQDSEGDSDLKSLIGSDKTQNKRHLPPIWSEVDILLVVFIFYFFYFASSVVNPLNWKRNYSIEYDADYAVFHKSTQAHDTCTVPTRS